MKYGLLYVLVVMVVFACGPQSNNDKYAGWANYGGTKEGTRYSSLTQVDTNNVQQLAVAWAYHTGDADTARHSQIQCNPIVVDGLLYGATPTLKIFAVDAATGAEKWVFDPLKNAAGTKVNFGLSNIRGLCYWKQGSDKRLFYTAGSYLYAINAVTGTPVIQFGDSGKIDLHNGLGRDVADLYISYTSPAMVYENLLIFGSRVDEGPNAAPGHIRAVDAHTGKQVWIFHTIPQPGEEGYETWDDPGAYKKIGGVNCWSGFTLDEKSGLLFVPLGSASYDFYGGMRKGNNLYANCLLALNAATGKKVWHFQTIHHDVWDRDLPTPPALVTITKNGQKIEAVAQPTKTGYTYVFERATGKPLFPVVENKVTSTSQLSGEQLSATQPMPTLPKPFVRQVFSPADINPFVSSEEQAAISEQLAGLAKGHMFTPPSTQGTVIFPGYDGGAEWGGPAYDAATNLLYVNANEMPWILTMKPTEATVPKNENWLAAGQRLYNNNCMSCHGTNRQGGGNYPSLVNARASNSESQFHQLLLNGRRMMPAFKQLTPMERSAIASYVLNIKKQQTNRFTEVAEIDSFTNLPYMGTGYNKFLTKQGLPAIAPPWGTLNAINLATGAIEWKVPLGEKEPFKSQGIITGTENYGGPVVTAGGLVFIAATSDQKFRAFNKRTGKMVWETTLPACGFATPAVYSSKGKQMIVIACGGGKLNTRSGDTYLAFALP